VIWAFTVDAIDSGTTKFTNIVEVRTAPGYVEELDKRGVPFATASEAAQRALSAHNAEETPLFAKDIESKALAKRWG
jgi:alpha-D-ribose 1-methylphosphonate 5-triphosphate synthase subunit PhnH